MWNIKYENDWDSWTKAGGQWQKKVPADPNSPLPKLLSVEDTYEMRDSVEERVVSNCVYGFIIDFFFITKRIV